MTLRHALPRFFLRVTLLVGVTGCESILGVGREERTAELVTDAALTPDGKGALVVDADTVAVGQLVPVRIRTAGGGCIRRAFVDVAALTDGVELRPYNSYPTSGDCTADFKVIEHAVSRGFVTAGIKRIRAVGLNATGALISVEDSVVVR